MTKSPDNAMGNAQQRCMFESPVKPDLSQSSEGAKRPAPYIYCVSHVLTRGCHLFRSSNAVGLSAENHKFFPQLLI